MVRICLVQMVLNILASSCMEQKVFETYDVAEEYDGGNPKRMRHVKEIYQMINNDLISFSVEEGIYPFAEDRGESYLAIKCNFYKAESFYIALEGYFDKNEKNRKDR